MTSATITPVIITVNGTGDPNPADTIGFAGMLGSLVGAVNPWEIVADMKAGLEVPPPPYLWQPIGYPAAVCPMRPSFMNAVNQIRAALGIDPSQLNWYDGPVYEAQVYPEGPAVLSGYSQGTCATDYVWGIDVYPEDGILHDRIDDIVSVCNFGDVYRAAGIANGNVFQGIEVPGDEDGSPTGGIAQAPNNLTEDQTNYQNIFGNPVVMSWALTGDLYGSSPQGEAGEVGKLVMDFVFDKTFTTFIEIAEALTVPVGMVEEIINAGVFFTEANELGPNGYPEAPHWQYSNAGCVASAAQYLGELATAIAAAA